MRTRTTKRTRCSLCNINNKHDRESRKTLLSDVLAMFTFVMKQKFTGIFVGISGILISNAFNVPILYLYLLANLELVVRKRSPFVFLIIFRLMRVCCAWWLWFFARPVFAARVGFHFLHGACLLHVLVLILRMARVCCACRFSFSAWFSLAGVMLCRHGFYSRCLRNMVYSNPHLASTVPNTTIRIGLDVGVFGW